MREPNRLASGSKLFAIYNAADLIEQTRLFDIEIRQGNNIEIISPEHLTRLIGLRGIWATSTLDESGNEYTLFKKMPKLRTLDETPSVLHFILESKLDAFRSQITAQITETNPQIAHGDVPYTLSIHELIS